MSDGNELPQLDDLLGHTPKSLRLAADMMKLIADDLLEGEDWGEMADLKNDILRLEQRLWIAARTEERREPK